MRQGFFKLPGFGRIKVDANVYIHFDILNDFPLIIVHCLGEVHAMVTKLLSRSEMLNDPRALTAIREELVSYFMTTV